ncbi:glutathione S-transferase [Rhizorhabdus wittichii DC-6]|nr:glutathione S-transferase [Rhizorhabdus wittichii DC-6]
MSARRSRRAMPARPIFYSFRRCPYAMRARLALQVSGTVCELREVKLSAKPAALIAASPKATVPVLHLPDGEVIDQSLDIMRWALGQADPEGWLDRADAALIAANDGPFKHHLDRYKYPDRHGSDSAEHRTAGLGLLAALEERLARTAHLDGPARGLTDAAIFPFVRQFAETDRAWFDAQPMPHLHDWLARQLGSALFAAAMVRPDPWQPGDPPLLFPAG